MRLGQNLQKDAESFVLLCATYAEYPEFNKPSNEGELHTCFLVPTCV